MQSFVCQLNRVGCKTNKLRVILEVFDILYLDGADAEENHHLFIFGVDFKQGEQAMYSEPDIHTSVIVISKPQYKKYNYRRDSG